MKIILNGERHEIDSSCTVVELLKRFDLDGAPCAVEVNAEVVPRREHAARGLRDGDTIEIVTLVGGG